MSQLDITDFGMHLFFYEEQVKLCLQVDQKPNRSQGGKWE